MTSGFLEFYRIGLDAFTWLSINGHPFYLFPSLLGFGFLFCFDTLKMKMKMGARVGSLLGGMVL